ncbi:MAG: hypothetical protein ACI4TB_06910 [Lachnospiraceae bacterium]
MFTYSIIQWLFFFYFYCFLGWCFESSYVSIKQRKWVNRGFMKGPFLPIYGSGAIMMYVVSKPFLDHWWAVYIAGCIGATLLEYVTGVVMEALFKVRYWDYSNQPFNFQGHICLGSSLAWGVFTLLMAYVIHQPVESLVLAIPNGVLTVVTILLTVYIASDFALSFKEALDLRDILVQMEKAKDELYRMQKRLDVIIAVTSDGWNSRKEAFAESVEQKKEALTESVEQKKEALSESIEQRKDAIAEALRIEDLKAGIERRMNTIKETLVQKPEEYSKDTREELLNLRTEYKLHTEKNERLGSIKAMSRRIRNNPTMSSVKYKEALEELKKKAEQRKK